MVGGRRGRQGRFVRRIGTLLAITAFGAASGVALGAGATVNVVGTTTPSFGVGIDDAGQPVTVGSTENVTVTRQDFGDEIVVTVSPRG